MKPAMMVRAALLFGALLGLTAACSPTDEGDTDAPTRGDTASRLPIPDEDYPDAAQAALELGYGDDLERAARELTRVIEHHAFAALPDELRHDLLSIAGYAAAVREQPASARAYLLSAIAVDARVGNDWLLLWQVEAALGLDDVAIGRLTHYVRRFPEELDEMGLVTFSNALQLPRAGAASRIDLLQAVFDSGWAPHGEDLSYYWVELARLRVDAGQVQQAAAVLGRVTAPLALVSLRSDKRFDALVDASAPRFDVERAAARQRDGLRARHAADPNDLHVANQLLDALLAVGEHQAVLDLTGELMAKVATGGTRADELSGLEQLNWLRNQRATALTRLGRFDDALVEMQLASALDEAGRPNVSQVLNLAGYFAAMQRPDDPLATLDKVGVMSGYGRMVQESVRLQAAIAKEDAALAADALSYLRAHAAEGPMVLVAALIDSGDEDAAATTLIAMLASAEERADLLLWLQEFRERPPLPAEKAVAARWKAVRGRSDVRQAIASVGRIQRYAIFRQ